MKSVKIMSYFLSMLMITGILLLSNANSVKAISAPRITYSTTGNTSVNKTFDINVKISDLENLYGASIDFVYDTSLIEIVSIQRGDLLKDNRLNDIFTKNINGKASLVSIMMGNQEPIKGSGTLFNIKAKALKPGKLNLNTTSDNTGMSINNNSIKINLSDNFGEKIEYDANSNVIEIEGKSIPTNSYEETSPLINFTGKWSDRKDANYSNGNSKVSDDTNAYISFSFNGTGFKLFGYTNKYRGIAKITVDNNVYSGDSFDDKPTFNKNFFEKLDLDNKRHDVIIQVTKTKNPKAVSNHISIDKIEIIDGALVETAPAVILANNSYEETSPLMNFTGNWSDRKDNKYSNGSSKVSDDANASISFSFTGTGFKLFGYTNKYRGIAKVTVDNVVYSADSFTDNEIFNKNFFEKLDLDNKKHDVTIQVTKTKNPKAISSHISIDKIEIINGTLVASNPPVISNNNNNSYEETSPLIKLTGNWLDRKHAKYSNGNSKISEDANASISFSFTGTGFKLFGYTNKYRGIAKVTVDNVVYSADSFTDKEIFNQNFFEKLDLDNKKHDVTIQVTKTKNKNAISNHISIDKIEIINGELVASNAPVVSNNNSYEETSPLIKLTGNWLDRKHNNYSDGSSKISEDANASISFSFTGTGFKLFGYTNKYRGIAKVTVDNVVYSADSFTDKEIFKQNFFEKLNLDNKKHNVIIQVTKTKNKNAISNHISIDKIEIIDGTLGK